MIKLKVGDSEVNIWEDPYGVKAKVRLFSYSNEELVHFVDYEAFVRNYSNSEVAEKDLARYVAIRLEMISDSALMMAEELRKRYEQTSPS